MDLRRVIFANLAVRIGASRIEVPQRDPAQPVGAFEMRQRALYRQPRPTPIHQPTRAAGFRPEGGIVGH